MATDVEIRAQIDAELVKALLLINGGAAVALIALLPYLLDRSALADLSQAILIALLIYQGALVSAVISSRLRRICSLRWTEAKQSSPEEHRDPCILFRHRFKEPCVCYWATAFIWISIILFVAAGVTVAQGGFQVLSG